METTPNAVPKTNKTFTVESLTFAIVGVVGVGAIALVVNMMKEQTLAPTPSISVQRSALQVQGCKVGEACNSLTVRAQDPEGEQVVIRFYDQATGEQVGEPITAKSGEEVTPQFMFDKAGEQKLYMVVEDGAGHTSQDYPVIIPVNVE